MSAPPIPFVWSEAEKAFRPLPRFHNVASASYGDGEVVMLAPIEERSAKNHNHYFACIHQAWLNLPEDLAERLPTEEHLRKHALIKTGFADHRQFVCSSKAEAVRFAAFLRPLDEYAIVTVSEAVVTVYTAQSQSMRAMGKERFQDSKDRVLSFLAGLIQVDPAELSRTAKEAA